MYALGELLVNVEYCQMTFEPKRTEVLADCPVVCRLSVIRRIVLEFSRGWVTVCSVAVAR
jgi:hypothetical protein